MWIGAFIAPWDWRDRNKNTSEALPQTDECIR
jgi:hypothetical protein